MAERWTRTDEEYRIARIRESLVKRPAVAAVGHRFGLGWSLTAWKPFGDQGLGLRMARHLVIPVEGGGSRISDNAVAVMLEEHRRYGWSIWFVDGDGSIADDPDYGCPTGFWPTPVDAKGAVDGNLLRMGFEVPHAFEEPRLSPAWPE